jgi:hypothetical protein
MRLLIQILIVAGLICLGWNKPFKEWAAQGYTMVTSKIPSALSGETRLRKAP